MPVPADILRAAAETRLEWFERLIFEHPRMASARDQLFAALGTRVFRPEDDAEPCAPCAPRGSVRADRGGQDDPAVLRQANASGAIRLPA